MKQPLRYILSIGILVFLGIEQNARATVFTVTNTSDTGTGSLRQAVLDANGSPGLDDIVFDPGTNGTYINVFSPVISITDDINIIGNGSNNTLIANDGVGIFEVVAGVNTSFSGLGMNGTGQIGINTLYPTGNMNISQCEMSGWTQQAVYYYANLGNIIVDQCYIHDNANGVWTQDSYDFVVTNSTFVNNYTSGAIVMAGGFEGSGTFINNTVFGNNYGIYVIDPNPGQTMNIINNTCYANQGPGIYIYEFMNNGSAINVFNNISFANGTDFYFNSMSGSGSNPNTSNNIIETCSSIYGCPVFYSSADPLVGALQNNGGPTMTLAIGCNSPALDAGTGTGAPATDQRGISRYGQVDIGAYEYWPDSSSFAMTACNSYTSPSGLYTWNASGVYQDTVTSTSGCDSLLTIDLTINTSTSSTINPSACYTYTSPSGVIYTTSGTYSDIIPNAAGCDSVIVINLTINTQTTSTISPSVCGTYSSPGGNNYNASGTYYDTIPNAAGCDSVITINLIVNSNSTSTLTETACNSYTSPSGLIFTSSGTYQDTIPNYNGCDSLITINLTISSSSSSFSTSECYSYTSPSGQIWTTSGVYQDTIASSTGCDSILTIDLMIVGPVSTISLSGSTLTSDAAGAVYQWLDCDDGMNPVPGETGQSYTPQFDGSYALLVTSAGCADTSACTDVVVPIPDTPTAFSPDGDGVNETLKMDLLDPVNTVTFYNRWGDVLRVIENYNDIDNAWDGLDENGNEVSGTVFFTVKSQQSYSGWVQVLR